MKTAKNIALILMSLLLVATVIMGGILLDRVMGLLRPSAPQISDTPSTAPSSSESVPASTPASTVPTVPTVPIHQCDFTIQGKTYAPTCDMLGYTVYTCECGEADYRDYVDSLGHLYGDYIVIAPTCTKDGWTQRTCSRCNQTERKNTVEARHSFTDWSPIETPERETRTCTACEETQLRSTVSGETWTLVMAKPEPMSDYTHIKVTVTPAKKEDPYTHHIYVALPDVDIRFDYSQGYLLIYYTVADTQKANAITEDQTNVTINAAGILSIGKPDIS